MSRQAKIFICNFLAVLFALFTLVSLGSVAAEGALVRSLFNASFFAVLCYFFADMEKELTAAPKRRKRAKLSVYKGKTGKSAA